jgi:5-formyltetrahydrofolate cyclo-ligase
MAQTDKAGLRARMRTARLAYAAVAPPIIPPGEFIDRLDPPGVIASYLPMPGEADPSVLATTAQALGWQLALPHVIDRASPMRFLAWRPGDLLVAGPFGLRQPVVDARQLVPDIILTPLLAFDAALNRLGQGAGYYDRVFASLGAVLRIGVAWSIQRVEALPVDPWDMPLHGVIDEYGWTGPEHIA